MYTPIRSYENENEKKRKKKKLFDEKKNIEQQKIKNNYFTIGTNNIARQGFGSKKIKKQAEWKENYYFFLDEIETYIRPGIKL